MVSDALLFIGGMFIGGVIAGCIVWRFARKAAAEIVGRAMW
jgi:hypothetical protein